MLRSEELRWSATSTGPPRTKTSEWIRTSGLCPPAQLGGSSVNLGIRLCWVWNRFFVFSSDADPNTDPGLDPVGKEHYIFGLCKSIFQRSSLPMVIKIQNCTQFKSYKLFLSIKLPVRGYRTPYLHGCQNGGSGSDSNPILAM